MAETKMLLSIALSAAVPLWAEQVARYRPEARVERARAAGEILSCFGDTLQFRPKTKRETNVHRDLIDIWLAGEHNPKPPPTPGEVFNALAEGIACALHGGDCNEEVLELRRKYVWGVFSGA